MKVDQEELCGGKVVHKTLKIARKAYKGLRDGKQGNLSLYPCRDREGLKRFGFHYHVGNLVGRITKQPPYRRNGRRIYKVPSSL